MRMMIITGVLLDTITDEIIVDGIKRTAVAAWTRQDTAKCVELFMDL